MENEFLKENKQCLLLIYAFCSWYSDISVPGISNMATNIFVKSHFSDRKTVHYKLKIHNFNANSM